MKTISVEQSLSVSGGSIGYAIFTYGGMTGGAFGGAILAAITAGAGAKRPSSCVAVGILSTLGFFGGGAAGYIGGAVGYTVLSNVVNIVTYPLYAVDYIFKPAA